MLHAVAISCIYSSVYQMLALDWDGSKAWYVILADPVMLGVPLPLPVHPSRHTYHR